MVPQQHTVCKPAVGLQVATSADEELKLETVSIAEPLQNRQYAPLMLSTLGSKEKREGG